MRSSFTTVPPSLQQQQQQQQQQHPLANLPHHHHPSSLSFLSPSRTAVTSFTPKCQSFEQGDWVVALAVAFTTANASTGSSSIACALSNGEVQVYDPQRLHRLVTYTEEQQQHQHPLGSSPCITDLKYYGTSSSSSSTNNSNNSSSDDCSSCLWVTSANGTVRLYDTRQQACAGQVQLPRAGGIGGGGAAAAAAALDGFAPSSSPSLLSSSSPAWTIAIGYNGTLAAVASKRKIHFFDVRMMSSSSSSVLSASSSSLSSTAASPWLGCYKDSHTDHVTCLDFVPNQNQQSSTTLLSGGEDGLVCLFDTTRPSEAEALQQVWNVGSSVRKLGTAFDYDSNNHRNHKNYNNNMNDNNNHFEAATTATTNTSTTTTSVWCLTGSETFQLWNPASNTVHSFGENLRQQLSSKINVYNSNYNHNNHIATTATPTASLPRNLDYLVDAHWDAANRELLLTAGNAQGDAALFRFSSTHPAHTQNYQYCCTDNIMNNDNNINNNQHQDLKPYDWEPCHVMSGGHRGVVRALCHFSPSIMLTAGEDARLCEWNRWGPQAHSASSSSSFLSSSASGSTTSSNRHYLHHHAATSSSSMGVASAGGGGPVRRPRSRPNAGPY